MTSHLAPDDFVAALERTPDGRVAEHLTSCDACRTEWESLRQGWDALAGSDVPEPSPLFWDHFPSRVREATRDVASDGGLAWWAHRRLLWGVGVAALVVLAVGGALRAPGPASEALAGSGGITAVSDGVVDFDEVADLFADLPPDEAQAFAPAGTATWALVDDLTLEERAAFVRLVERELEALP